MWFRSCATVFAVATWSFLTNHARALLFIHDNPDTRLRDLGAALEVTERTAFGIVADLTEAGYVVKERDGRRNRYHLQDHLLLNDPLLPERTIGQLLDLLAETRSHLRNRRIGDVRVPPSP
ncbi:hypothetical protein BH10ACT1_BH10ACT1_34160 [soil metagenome]